MTEKTPDTQPVPPADEPDQLQVAAAQANDYREQYLRAVADLDNYRKRVARERDELTRFTREEIVAALLPALDNLERALDHSPVDTPLHEGLLQVHKQFQRALADFGLEELTLPAGAEFDPKVHEAVSHVASPDHPEGAVISQLQSGYRLAGRLLRAARVVVSKGPPSTPEPPSSA